MSEPARNLRLIRVIIFRIPPTQVPPWRVRLLPKRWVKMHLGTTSWFLEASQLSPRPQHLFLQMNLLATLYKKVATVPLWKPAPQGVVLLLSLHPKKSRAEKSKPQTFQTLLRFGRAYSCWDTVGHSSVPLVGNPSAPPHLTPPPPGVLSIGWVIWLSFFILLSYPFLHWFCFGFAKRINKLL